LVGGSEAFAAAAGEVDDELREHEAGDCAAEGGLEGEDCGEGRAEVFDAADEVASVDVVLLRVGRSGEWEIRRGRGVGGRVRL
jgi:hypothetical protein